jgi:hypothetical protein
VFTRINEVDGQIVAKVMIVTHLNVILHTPFDILFVDI